MPATEHRALTRRLPIYAGLWLLVWFAGEGILAFYHQRTIPSTTPAASAAKSSTAPNDGWLLCVTVPQPVSAEPRLQVSGPGNFSLTSSWPFSDTIRRFMRQSVSCDFTDPQPTRQSGLVACRECQVNVTVTGFTVFLEPKHPDSILDIAANTIHYRFKVSIDPATAHITLANLSPREDFVNVTGHSGIAAAFFIPINNSDPATLPLELTFSGAYDPFNIPMAENYGYFPIPPNHNNDFIIWSSNTASSSALQGMIFFPEKPGDN